MTTRNLDADRQNTSVTEELIDIAIDRFSCEHPENEALAAEFRSTLTFMIDNSISELHRRDSWWLVITRSPSVSICITYAPDTSPHTKRTPTTEQILNRIMERAVQEEQYELAAIYRNRIDGVT